ncbi:hypothetical protein PanWU01x14_299330 [Parasponia andersonii]|uniref:Uncharacterized protein n=1 Tax=Parasponia andersonii TaxID=3476 RepID=A0A2P5AUE2_PARAD|nr:hypothetical protein PanWU01x14_299330 [Parasponia andersonii]
MRIPLQRSIVAAKDLMLLMAMCGASPAGLQGLTDDAWCNRRTRWLRELTQAFDENRGWGVGFRGGVVEASVTRFMAGVAGLCDGWCYAVEFSLIWLCVAKNDYEELPVAG